MPPKVGITLAELTLFPNRLRESLGVGIANPLDHRFIVEWVANWRVWRRRPIGMTHLLMVPQFGDDLAGCRSLADQRTLGDKIAYYDKRLKIAMF
jgi:hypothetical protein